MKPRFLKAVEILFQIVAVAVIALLGKNSYELVPYFELETKSVGFLVTTNTNQLFWHILVYSMYAASWFVFYYGIFKRHQADLKKKLTGGLIGWVLVTVIHTSIVFGISKMILPEPATDTIRFQFSVFSSIENSLFSFYLLLALIAFLAQTAMQFLYRYHELEQTDRVQSELALIRSQLRPHFFFNTLNNLYAMALKSRNETLADGIQNLTGMMRYTLKHSTLDLVPLSDEWNYISQYIALQKLRLDPEMVEITVQASGNIEEARIAPMILINFVENAFKHGVSYKEKSSITIKLEVTNSTIRLSVTNSNHPSDKDSGISGIGTSQTKKLLSLYYNDDYDLDITSTQECHKVVLTLPTR